MSWTSPKTYTANSTLSAADLNTFLRDNMLECEPAKAQNPGGYFVSTGLNAIAERVPVDNYSSAAGTLTTTGSFGDLTTGGVGPAVTVTTGIKAVVMVNCGIDSDQPTGTCWAGYGITGSSTISASVDRSVVGAGPAPEYRGGTFIQTGLTPGSNTFTMKYYGGSGTGSPDGSSKWTHRRIAVIPL